MFSSSKNIKYSLAVKWFDTSTSSVSSKLNDQTPVVELVETTEGYSYYDTSTSSVSSKLNDQTPVVELVEGTSTAKKSD